jgi:hypothetical protein
MNPELSFEDMLRPVVIMEANGIPVKPREPNNGTTEEGPQLTTRLQVPWKRRTKKALLPGQRRPSPIERRNFQVRI